MEIKDFELSLYVLKGFCGVWREISDLINVAACDACVEIKNTFYKNRKEK